MIDRKLILQALIDNVVLASSPLFVIDEAKVINAGVPGRIGVVGSASEAGDPDNVVYFRTMVWAHASCGQVIGAVEADVNSYLESIDVG